MRLSYLAHRYLHLDRWEVALMPLGVLLDLIECHWQHTQPGRTTTEPTIDDVIPAGI